MDPAFVVRFRPVGPWRIGPESGARDRVDPVFHSDRVFSAVTNALAELGHLDEWLDATVRNPGGPAVRFSSLFPFLQSIDFIVPPRTVWPPQPSTKIRWKGARFVPVSAAADLLREKPLNENRWVVDGASECLLPSELKPAHGPFRIALRSQAAVDRLSGNVTPHATACIEFAENAGVWALVSFDGEQAQQTWSERVKAALRLLADSGMGGERSSGWGRAQQPEFEDCVLPDRIFRIPEKAAPVEGEAGAEQPAENSDQHAYWMLSSYIPAEGDAIDWTRSHYFVENRAGRVISPMVSGSLKKTVRAVQEGSVIVAAAAPAGAAPNVAPDELPHPVFRAGFPVAIPVPLRNGTS